MDSWLIPLALVALTHLMGEDRAKVATWTAKHGTTGALLLDIFDFVQAYTEAKTTGAATASLSSGATLSVSATPPTAAQ